MKDVAALRVNTAKVAETEKTFSAEAVKLAKAAFPTAKARLESNLEKLADKGEMKGHVGFAIPNEAYPADEQFDMSEVPDGAAFCGTSPPPDGVGELLEKMMQEELASMKIKG